MKWFLTFFVFSIVVLLLRNQTYELKKIKYNYYNVDCIFCVDNKLKEICPHGWVFRNKYLTGITISCKDAWGQVGR